MLKYHTNVRLTPRQAEALDKLCTERTSTRAEIIRNAVDQHLLAAQSGTANLNRIAQLAEFMAIAIDEQITVQMPGKRDAILRGSVQRLEQFHGKR